MVPPGRVELHHRELGVVSHGHPFVAEVAVDFEHALKAADHQALQIELGCDAQEHLLVERVVVGGKRLGVGAAGDGVHHRRFDFQELVVDHEGADRGDGLGAGDEAGARLFVDDQVHVALAVLLLLVGHAVELVGQRTQGLGQQTDLGDLDRQLAGLGLEQGALGAQDVAQVPVLEGLQGVGADGVQGHIDLDAAGGVLQGAEAGLAHDALEHQAAADAGGDALGFQLGSFGAVVGGVQLGGAVSGLEIVGECHALGTDGGQFLAALGHQFVGVDRGFRSRFVREMGVGRGHGGGKSGVGQTLDCMKPWAQ